jgi:hypothetical protein
MNFWCKLDLSIIYELTLLTFLNDLNDLEKDLWGQSHTSKIKKKLMALVGRTNDIINIFDVNSMV